MKKDNKKALYESIMASVAKEVKKALNEGEYSIDNNSDLSNIISTIEVLKKYGKFGRKKRVLYTGVIF